jgi:CheY-specific phosphatase CheX
VKAEHINIFIEATGHVIKTMVHVPITLGKPRLRCDDDRLYKLYKVSATIELSGKIRGLFVLSLSAPVALALASGISGVTQTEINADSLDAVAEIANMIAGSAKQKLSSGAGGPLSMTVPKLVNTGDVVYPQALPFIAIPFDCPSGRFLIEVGLRDAQSTAA